MTIRRDSPYIHVSWLKKLLVGDTSCEWSTWFKSQNQQYAKQPSDFNLVAWRVEHTALLQKLKAELEVDDSIIRLENQNQFYLRGKNNVTVSGTPDLVKIMNGKGAIYDAKTGQQQDYDVAQMMIYMWALPYTRPEYKDMPLCGVLYYSDGYKKYVPQEAIDDDFRERIIGLIQRIGAATPATKIPSARECGFCDITLADCPERIDLKTDPVDVSAIF